MRSASSAGETTASVRKEAFKPIVEIVEVPQTKHPEFKSRPTAPHPLFLGLVESALKKKNTGPS